MEKIKKDAKALIAGNFANFHRYGWKEVAAILSEKAYFVHQQDIAKALKKAYTEKSLEKLNKLMKDFKIKSVYSIPKESKLMAF